MRLCYIQQEILAPREKSYGQGDLKTKKFETREMQLNLQSFVCRYVLLWKVSFVNTALNESKLNSKIAVCKWNSSHIFFNEW